MADKQEMLARIRAALGRDESTLAPAALPAFSFRSVAQTPEETINRFCSELEKVSGRVSRIDSPAAIKNYLENLIAKDAPASVAVSDAEALGDIGLREWLKACGASVTPTLREFAQADAHESDLQAATRAIDTTLIESYKRALMDVQIGVTAADYAIADTGTLVLVSQPRRSGDQSLPGERKAERPAGEQHRLISLVPPVHVCLLDSSRIVVSLADLMELARAEFYSGDRPPLAMTFITGPSRTADIELSLTLGVHGPRELHVLLYEPAEFAPPH